MQANSKQAVVEATSRVFETAAFLNVYPYEPGQDLPPPEQAATMTFRGAISGRVSIRVAISVLDSIVENVLEVHDNPEEQATRRGDVLKEMLNMLCGNLLTEYFGSEPIFDLSPPELLGEQAFPAPTSDDVQCVALNIENTLAEVMFEIQDHKNL